MLIALTRAVPPAIIHCELTHLSRALIDHARAVEQHRQYEAALVALGCTVERLSDAPNLPDAVFVEDAAVVLPEIAVITRPGAATRRGEIASVAASLARYRKLAFIESPGTLDGGDVLRIGTRLIIGLSQRTNAEGIRQLDTLVAPHGYTVQSVPVIGCLHLKSAVTQVEENTVLVNAACVDRAAFADLDIIEVHPDEPTAANALRVGAAVIHPAAHTKTRARMEHHGIRVHPVPADELEKAEAGVTCCSILLDA